jgi:hypothetical protein
MMVKVNVLTLDEKRSAMRRKLFMCFTIPQRVSFLDWVREAIPSEHGIAFPELLTDDIGYKENSK